MYHAAIWELVNEWAERENAGCSLSSNGDIFCYRLDRSVQITVHDDSITVFNNRPVGPGKFQMKIELDDPGSFERIERTLVQNIGTLHGGAS